MSTITITIELPQPVTRVAALAAAITDIFGEQMIDLTQPTGWVIAIAADSRLSTGGSQ